MKFRYSFQKIVDLKSNETTQAKWVLSDAVGRLRDEEESLTTLYTEKDQVESELSSSVIQNTKVSDLRIYQSYLEHLDERIRHKAADVRHAEHKVDEKRQILSSKMVEEKVWNQARHKAYLLHQAEVLKKEQETLDEMATVRYKRPM